jgi:hypothetical protein
MTKFREFEEIMVGLTQRMEEKYGVFEEALIALSSMDG